MDKLNLEGQLEELHPATFGWALGCCRRNRQEAEDVLQTTYLKILDGRAKFNGRSSLKTWLFAVIRKTASENRRRNLLRRVLLIKWALSRQSSAVADPEGAIENSEKRPRLLLALQALPRRQREVLELVFYHDLTIEESAGVLGISVGTARVHYERGKGNLRSRLTVK